MMPVLCRQNLNLIINTSKPSVGKVGWEEADYWDCKCIDRKLGMKSFKLHKSLSGKPIIKQLINEVMILPMAEFDI